uniref:Pentatricopeptide repeat-containing protein At3g58590 family n=1 Tax=Cajanus cajan TaxID=3821 RepID=A0A151TP97_CAJCA|nr:Pentatricopeptide repeat-containing protein At3g58590 family [Cajanus cajan]
MSCHGQGFRHGQLLLNLLEVCSTIRSLDATKCLHALSITMGHIPKQSIFIHNNIISSYVSLGEVLHARKVFDALPQRTVVSYNTLINAYCRRGDVDDAWNLLSHMRGSGFSPTQYTLTGLLSFIDALVKSERPVMALELFLNMASRGLMPSQATFVAVIESCTSLRNLVCGESVHAKVIRSGFESDVIVGTSLVDFYAKCDRFISAHKCFDRIEEKNVVSWNTLMLGYSNSCTSTSILLLQEMLQLGYSPNEFSFSAVLKSSSISNLLQLHVKLLSLLENPDVVSWNIVISACARSNSYNEVFAFFKHMHSASIYPDSYTFMSLLSVCTKLCRLDLGSSLHGLVIKTNLGNNDTFLGNVLVDMYGKCGSIDSAVKVFEEIMHKNIITWTTLITALGLNGYACEAVMRFQNMESTGLKPDALALRAVLSSCRYGGLVSEGMEIFRQMGTSYGIAPEHDHYHCIVDLLAKNGQIKEAEKIIASMPFPPNANIWRSFLEGYSRQEIAN